ncbi:caspase, EACC1-associated type [Streptomyces sp. NPDC002143]
MGILPDPDSSQVVLLGVHSYDQLADLPAVSNNLVRLADVLCDEAVWGLPSSNCTIVSQPRSVQDALDPLIHAARRASDTLVVYYAGHGILDPDTDELYLALEGSNKERLYTALPYEWLRRAVLDPLVTARRKVVILDCCYSGRALTGSMSGTDQVGDHALIEGTYLLTASAETRAAVAPQGDTFTAFTGELVTTLAEGIAGGPAVLDMDTLYRHLHSQLAAKSRPLPQQRNRNTGAQIALARNRSFAAADPPLKSSRGVSYAKLEQLLVQQKWLEADQETADKFLEVCGKDVLEGADILSFSCEDLKIMDRLWVAHSDGQFGFSVQARLWLDLGPQRAPTFDDDGKVDPRGVEEFQDRNNRFAEVIGWSRQGEWQYQDGGMNLTYNLSAPVGHLPGALVPTELNIGEGEKAVGGMWWVGFLFNAIYGRVVDCGLVRTQRPSV